MGPDGNCFFHVLVHAGVVSDHKVARSDVVGYVDRHWSELVDEAFLEEKTAHIARLRKDGEPVEAVELKAAAALYPACLVVVGPSLPHQFFGDMSAEDLIVLAFDGQGHYDTAANAPLVGVQHVPVTITTIHEARYLEWMNLYIGQIFYLRTRLLQSSQGAYDIALEAIAPAWREAWCKRRRCMVAWQFDGHPCMLSLASLNENRATGSMHSSSWSSVSACFLAYATTRNSRWKDLSINVSGKFSCNDGPTQRKRRLSPIWS